MDAPERWVCMYEVDGSPWCLVESDEPRIDAAVTDYLNSCGMKDRLIDLTTVDGFDVKMPVSRIANWFVSDPEGRKRHEFLDHWQEKETERVREELGIAGTEDWQG